jgi:putative redox protein
MSKILASVKAHNSAGVLKTDLQVENFSFVADEPLLYGGQELGPTPADYLCMALASCQAITLRMYAKRKGWELPSIDVKVDYVKASDMPTGKNTFNVEINLEGVLEPAQLKRIEEIARACPIHRLLSNPIDLITKLSSGKTLDNKV